MFGKIQKPSPAGAERIRGPNLRALAGIWDAVTMQKALRLADDGNFVLAANRRILRAFVENGEWVRLNGAFLCWSGTMAGYKEPGRKLGRSILYTDPHGVKYLFPVPREYRKERDMVLITEHPDFRLVWHRGRFVVDASRVAGLGNFPERDGWYLREGEFGIPCGEACGPDPAPPSPGAGYLLRLRRSVGLVACGNPFLGSLADYAPLPPEWGSDNPFMGYCDSRYANFAWPYGRFGALAESPEWGMPENFMLEEGGGYSKLLFEIAGISPAEFSAALEGFSRELGRLGEEGKGKLIANAMRIEQLLKNASMSALFSAIPPWERRS